MKKIRLSALFGALAAASAASASFDLMMILDAGTGTLNGGVHRYDPMTGTYLGRFAYGWTNSALDLAINASNGEAYILENINTANDRVLVFDYSTGNFKRMFDVGSNAVRLATASNGDLLFAGWDNLGSIRRLSNSGVFRRNYTGDRTVPSTGVAEVNNRIISFVPNQGILGWVPDTGASITPSLLAYFPTTSNAVAVGNQFVYALGTGLIANAPITSTTVGFAAGGVSLGSVVPILAPGHDSVVFAGIDTGTSTTVYRASLSGGIYGSFVASQVVQPIGAVNVVAPEPGTLLALGAGSLALLRRRRRR